MKQFFLIILISLTLNIYCQENSIGFYDGINISNIYSKKSFSKGYKDPIKSSNRLSDKNEYKYGILTGLNYNHTFKNRLLIASDLKYSQTGFVNFMKFYEIKNDTITYEFVSNYSFKYLSIPLKIGYSIGNKLSGLGKIGICPSFLINAETTNELYSKNPTHHVIYNLNKLITKFDLSGLIELSINYKLNKDLKIFYSTTFNTSITKTTILSFYNNIFYDVMRQYSISSFIGIEYCFNKNK